MIDCKRKITLSAAEIVNEKPAFFGKVAVDILNVFEESTNLSELVLLFVVDSTRSVADSKFNKKAFVA
jgi:hypothetical protein